MRFLAFPMICLCVGSLVMAPSAVRPAVLDEVQQLLPPEGISFENAIAIDGDTLLVASVVSSSEGTESGPVYLFMLDSRGEWREQSWLEPSDGSVESRFGESIAIDGDTAVVGAPFDGQNGEEAGAVYVYRRDVSGEWYEEAKLLAGDGSSYHRFGWSVALDADTLAIGATGAGENEGRSLAGAVYIFERVSAGSWQEQAKIAKVICPGYDMWLSCHLGRAVSLDGDTLLAGDPFVHRGEHSGFGAAHVYIRDDTGNWAYQDMLVPSVGCDYFDEEHSKFGWAVALERDTALIGAPTHHPSLGYVIVRDETGAWAEQAKLPGNWFLGVSVALDRDTAVLSDITAGSEESTFVAYVYTRDQRGQWTQRASLYGSDDPPVYWPGLLAMSGDNVVYVVAGKAYAFDLGELRGLQPPSNLLATVGDVNGTGSVDFETTTHSDDRSSLHCRDGADGSQIRQIDLGGQKVRLLETIRDVSGNDLDEVMALTITDEGKRVVRLFDSGDGALIRQMSFGRWFSYPVALLALDNADGGLAGRSVAVVQPDDDGRTLAIVRDAMTGQKIRTVRYGLRIGTLIGAAAIADIDGNGVGEIAVFGETEEQRAKVQIRDALTGEKRATFGFDPRFEPLLVGAIPSINGDASDELVVVGVNDAGAVRIEVKDSLSRERLTTRWLRGIQYEKPLAMDYVNHPAGPALAVLTEGIDGKYRARTKRLTSAGAGWVVHFPPHVAPQDFAVLDDTSGNLVPELLVVGENANAVVKVIARDAVTGEEPFRTRIP